MATQLNAMIAGTALDFNGNTIPPLDFFARNPIGTNPGQVTAAQFGTIFGTNIRSQSSYQEVFDGRVTGFPLHLPGGDVGLSFGGEYRLEGIQTDRIHRKSSSVLCRCKTSTSAVLLSRLMLS